MIESVIAEMLQLPTAPRSRGFYYALLADLSEAHRMFAVLIGVSMQRLFEKVDALALGCALLLRADELVHL